MAVALTVLALLAVLDWRTIEPGKTQQVVWLLLGFFTLRIVLGWLRSRKIENEAPERESSRLDV
jgi:hypothetical protein